MFKADIHRRKTKHKGENSYRYFGLKRKLEDSDNEGDNSAKKMCPLDPIQPTLHTVERFLQRAQNLENELAGQKQLQANLEYQLQDVTVKNQLLHQSALQSEQDKLALNIQPQVSNQ